MDSPLGLFLSSVLSQAIRDITHLYGDCSQHPWNLIPKDHEIKLNNKSISEASIWTKREH